MGEEKKVDGCDQVQYLKLADDKEQKEKCSLNMKCPHRFVCLNPCSIAGVVIWEDSGDFRRDDLLGVGHRETTLKFYRPSHFLLALCFQWVQWGHLASSSCHTFLTAAMISPPGRNGPLQH